MKTSGLYPAVGVEPRDVPAVGLAGARLLTETTRVTGLGNELSRALTAWRRTWSVHDPGKITANLVMCVALGGHCLSDLSPLRCDKELFGSVASDPTVSRLVGTPADHVKIIRQVPDQAGLNPRPSRKVLVRTDGAGGTKETIEFLTHRRVSYSAGFTLPDHTPQIHEHHPREPPGPRPTTLTASPDRVQTSLRPADLLNLTAWPDGMRLNRAPRPAPPGRPAALRGHRGLPAHRLHHPARGWVSSPTSRPATDYEPAARGPHRLRKRHQAQPLPPAELRAKPYLKPERDPDL